MLNKIYYWLHAVASKPEERGEPSAGYWQDTVRKTALALCEEKKGKLLEIGCGEGLFISQLVSINKDLQIYGIDNEKNMLEKAENRIMEKGIKDTNISQAEANALPFDDSFFDTVVCINVIPNLESWAMVKKALGEAVRVCKKGGSIIFDFRNSANPLLYVKYKLAPFYDQTVADKKLPLNTYKFNDISRLLKTLGLEMHRKIETGFFIKQMAPLIIIEAVKDSHAC